MNFSRTTQGDVSVEIDGAICVVTSVIDTAIECDTGSHAGSVDDATVEVQINGNGIAEEVGDELKDLRFNSYC